MVLDLLNLRKEYPGTVAVDDLTARFEGGKVHAIVGKNGSGKSTTIKMISGAVKPDQGSIRLDGAVLDTGSTRDAIRAGVATVYQELSLFPSLSIAENICFQELPKKYGRIDWNAAHERATSVLADLDLHVDTTLPVSSLSVGWQQLIEIAKATMHEPRVLILDEPTSALSVDEVDQLFATVKRVRNRGTIVLYITHRLQELPEIADAVSVLRDGKHVGTVDMAESHLPEIVNLMFGDVEHKRLTPPLPDNAPVVLSVRGMTREPFFHDLDFDVRAGEILGIAGMLGTGRTELLRSVFGADQYDAGSIRIGGEEVAGSTIDKMKDLGVAYTPESRKEHGLIQIQSVLENLTLAGRERFTHRGIRKPDLEQKAANRQIRELAIKVSSLDVVISSLSGGNQQKVVVGNWLNDEPSIVLLDEPSRGIDVEAKQQIFRILWDLSREGIAIVVVSTELEELIEIAHRILVLRDGIFSQEIDPKNTDAAALYAACMGVSS